MIDGSDGALAERPIRVLIVGTTSRLKRAATALEGAPAIVEGPVPSVADQREGTDCVITDDRETVRSHADDCPVIFVVASSNEDKGDPDRIPTPVADVLTAADIDTPTVLQYRIHRAVKQFQSGPRDRARASHGTAAIDGKHDETDDRVGTAFLTLDETWQVTDVNEQAVAVLDVDPAQLLGRSVGDIFPELDGLSRATEQGPERRLPQTVETRFEPADSWIEVHLYPTQTGLSVHIRDITSHVERERALLERTERLQTLVENVPVILFVLDPDGKFTLSEGRGLDLIGLEAGEIVGHSVFEAFDDKSIHRDVRRALAGNRVHSQRSVRGRVFENWYRPVTTSGEVERIIGVSVDVTQRVQYEQTLSSLHEATQSLLAIDTASAACDRVVDVATDVLDLTSVAVYLFDECANELVPTANSPDIVDHIGQLPRFQPGGSITWRVFTEGTPKLFDDVRTSPDNYDGDLKTRSGLFIPLGKHGVLIALSTETGLYDEETFELAQLLGATAETALDRIEQTSRLHNRERELKRQNQQLERLNRASQIRGEVEQLLLRATSREEIERGVCACLTEFDPCSFAWIGEPDPGGNQLSPRATAGSGRGYLEAVTVTTVDDEAAEPTGRATRRQQFTHVENVADAFHDGSWRAEALSRRFQSIVSIPLIYDGFLYGVCSVYADRPNGFDEAIRSTLRELGEQIAYAIDAVTRKNALLSQEVTEIDVGITDGSSLMNAAAALDTTIELEGAIPQEDGSTIVFLATDADIEPAALDTIDGLDIITTIGDRDSQTLLQGRLVDPFLGSAVATHGGTLHSLTIKPDGLYAQIDVPQLVEVREVLAGITRQGWAASLTARRERTADDRHPVRGTPESVLEALTDRQREVVQTAYHGGFFEWPRTLTGEEIADSLGISPPAFHNHVRTAQRKLFTTLFDNELPTENIN